MSNPDNLTLAEVKRLKHQLEGELKAIIEKYYDEYGLKVGTVEYKLVPIKSPDLDSFAKYDFASFTTTGYSFNVRIGFDLNPDDRPIGWVFSEGTDGGGAMNKSKGFLATWLVWLLLVALVSVLLGAFWQPTSVYYSLILLWLVLVFILADLLGRYTRDR